MNTVVSLSWSISVLLGVLTFGIATQSLLPLTHYQHEVVYPSGEVERTLTFGGRPLTVTTGLRIRPSVPYLPIQPPSFLPRMPNVYDLGYLRRSLPRDLFRPNILREKAAASGQIDNYNKALEEEAKEAEQSQNDITTVFESSEELNGITTNQPTSFVSVNVKRDKEYNYNYAV